VAFSPDSSKLAYPFEVEDPTNRVGVALWDLSTHRVTDEFAKAPEGYPFMTFSHNGRLLAYVSSSLYETAHKDNIVICDLTRERPPFELVGHEAAAGNPDFSPDDQWLVTPHADGKVILWDLKSRRILQRLVGHSGSVFFARFSPDGRTLATGGIDGSVRLWDLRDAAVSSSSFTLGTHNSTVFGLGFSPNGKLLVSASLDHTAKVWDVARRKELDTLRGHDQRVYSASFSPDGRFIMTGSEDSSVKIWRTPEMGPDEPLDQHLNENYSSLEFSPDGRWLLAGEEGYSKLWDVASRTTNTLNLVRCRFSPNTNSLVGLNANGQLTVWNVSTRQPRLILTVTNGQPFTLDSDLAFSPDGRTLAGVQTNGDLTIWSLDGEMPRLVRKLTNTAGLHSPLFSPDGTVLAIQSAEDTVTIWNWAEGRQISHLRDGVPPKQIVSCAFSPNGRIFLTKYEPSSQYGIRSMRLWDTTGWSPGDLLTAEHHVFSADSHWFATGRAIDTQVRLWDMSSHTFEDLPSGSGPVDCLTFSPDGRTLAVGTRDGWINLWHLPSRQEITSLRAHRSHALRAVFSPDGRTLATAGSDGKLRLWTAPTLAETDASGSLEH
jgi:WD40 repeat protein